jgi:hypothetical protein
MSTSALQPRPDAATSGSLLERSPESTTAANCLFLPFPFMGYSAFS